MRALLQRQRPDTVVTAYNYHHRALYFCMDRTNPREQARVSVGANSKDLPEVLTG